jgi:molecular chaperone GrpE
LYIFPDFEENGMTKSHDKNAERTKLAASPEPAPVPQRVEKVEIGAEELEELRSQAGKAQEHWERLLRATADFENFKKRTARERQEAAKYVHEPLLLKLIPVLDNFEMALAAAQSADGESVRSLRTGVSMIQQQFRTALAEAGLEEIDATGKPFDPNWHEAVSQQETTEVPEGHVVQQLRKGYKLRERLLRPAGVMVAKAPPKPSENE